jgi:hypothetical protein
MYESHERVAPFEIRAAAGSHYLVKLVRVDTNAAALTVFVHGGKTVSIEVPLGRYEVRYASGTVWRGHEWLFGPEPETVYSKADRVFDFHVSGTQVNGYTITLYAVPNGNLHTSKINALEF